MRTIIEKLSLIVFIICITIVLILYFYNPKVKKDIQPKQEKITNVNVEKNEENTILNEYISLYNQNPDIIGWINIPNTNIDYPVMQSKEDNEKYLHLNFEEKFSFSGTPFLDNRCNIEENSDNLLVYGHNMRNNTMFADLIKYKNIEFYKKNPYIFFDTIYEKGKYEIISCFSSPIYNKNDDVFKYYYFFGSSNKEEFDNYVKGIKNLSLYDTEIEVNYGDKLLTLSTCINKSDRFVVVAKKV